MNSRLFHILNKYCFNKMMSIYELRLTHKMLVKIRMSHLVQTIFLNEILKRDNFVILKNYFIFLNRHDPRNIREICFPSVNR